MGGHACPMFVRLRVRSNDFVHVRVRVRSSEKCHVRVRLGHGLRHKLISELVSVHLLPEVNIIIRGEFY